MVVSAQRSILNTEQLAGWLAHAYDATPPGRCTFLALGVNDHYLWEREDGPRCVARVYRRNWRTPAQIEAECRFIRHLQQRGLSLASPLPLADGSLVGTLTVSEGERHVVLFTHADGVPATATDAYRYGALAAALHDAADDFGDESSARPAMNLDELLDRPLAGLESVFAHRPADLADIRRLAKFSDESLRALPLPALNWGWCHNDLNGGNVHVDGETLTLFDFDFAGPGWRAQELAVFRWVSALAWPGQQEEAWADFLRGYSQRRPLSERELRAIDLFVLARHLWWMNLQKQSVESVGGVLRDDGFLTRMVTQLRDWEQRLSAAT